jgi:hypothetical protein
VLDILKVGRRSIFEQVSDRVGAVFQELHGPGRKTSQTSPYDQEAAARSLEPFPDFGSMIAFISTIIKATPIPQAVCYDVLQVSVEIMSTEYAL